MYAAETRARSLGSATLSSTLRSSSLVSRPGRASSSAARRRAQPRLDALHLAHRLRQQRLQRAHGRLRGARTPAQALLKPCSSPAQALLNMRRRTVPQRRGTTQSVAPASHGWNVWQLVCA